MYFTDEKDYIMRMIKEMVRVLSVSYTHLLSCNELVFDVCINQKDLLGEPMPGRRFKGTIWLQGKINFL